LQGGSGKRRKRVTTNLPAVDLGDDKSGRAQNRLSGGPRPVFGVEIEAVEPLAVEMGQPRGEGLSRFGAELDLDRPVLARLERLDLGFTLANQAQCNGLDASGRTATRELAPQHRR